VVIKEFTRHQVGVEIARDNNKVSLRKMISLGFACSGEKQIMYRYSIADASNGVCCAIVFVNGNQIAVHASLISSSKVPCDLLLGIPHCLRQNNGI
jgi:hypothetical protein